MKSERHATDTFASFRRVCRRLVTPDMSAGDATSPSIPAPARTFLVSVIAAGIAALIAAIAMFRGDHGWLVPLVAVPVYLTFRSYRIYLDRIESEKLHNAEVLRLLDAARHSEQRYALAAAGSNDGMWDWDIPKDLFYCSDRWKMMLGLSAETPFDPAVPAHDRAALRDAALFRSDRLALQHEQVTRLAERLPLPQIPLPFLFTAGLTPADIDVLAAALEAGVASL